MKQKKEFLALPSFCLRLGRDKLCLCLTSKWELKLWMVVAAEAAAAASSLVCELTAVA